MIFRLSMCSFVAVFTAVSAAQVISGEPKAIPIADGITLTPLLDLTEAYDDNIYEASVTGDSSSWVTTISPSLLLDAIQGFNHHQLEYGFETDIFHSTDQDDNTDQHVRASSLIALNKANRIDVSANYDRVENVSDTSVVGQNDKFEITQLGANYVYGIPTSPFSIELGVNHVWFRSFNSGALNADREYDKPGARVTGYYRMAPKTRGLVEYRYDDYDYLLSSSSLDSKRDTYLVGLTWTATARTIGTIKVGREERDFDNSSKKDTDGSTWETDLVWQPTKRATLTFNTTKGTEEGSITEDVVDVTRFGVFWNHQLSPRFTSDVSYGYADEEYQDLLGREDEINEAGIGVRYEVSRWMTVGLGYRYKDRDSNIPVRDYDRNLYMLNMNLSL